MEIPTDSIPRLPDELIVEILTRLPVISLLRCRCVCKSWLSLISSPRFVRYHLRKAKQDPDYAHHRIMLNYHGDLMQCSVPSLLRQPIVDAFDTDYSVRFSMESCWIMGSCDGLICLAIDTKGLFLWNPSTRVCKKLPDFGVNEDFCNFAYGLGFDKSSDDYKVVGVFIGDRNSYEVAVKVYSLKSNQWKRIENFKGRWLLDKPATYAHGKLHWIANYDWEFRSAWKIVSLDLGTEEYGVVEMPNNVENDLYSKLGACEECLYLLCSHSSGADLWIMDDCGVGKGTWTKVASIPYIVDFTTHTYRSVLYVLENGEVVLLSGLKFVIFNPKDCSFRSPEIRNTDALVAANTYIESLVSPL
ncbi:UNVERIFIED_CONTAM: putative F-box protein [Sesamum calycinum]|uniref:F-box protein n=1 Tax=Sesamum calycinum TaxID=2727403 RepID=A0AAW2R8V8_9LAMI